MWERNKEVQRRSESQRRTEGQERIFREILEKRIGFIQRKYMLLGLLNLTGGQLTKAQLNVMGERIARPLKESGNQDQESDSIPARPLPPVLMSELLESLGYDPARYPHAQNVALQYEKGEVEDLPDPSTVIMQPEQSIGSVDIWSGRGLSRKLLKEFYSLEGVFDVNIYGGHYSQPIDDLLIRPTAVGQRMGKDINSIYKESARHMEGYVHVARRYDNVILKREEAYPQAAPVTS